MALTSSPQAVGTFGERERPNPIFGQAVAGATDPTALDAAWASLLETVPSYGVWRLAYCVVFKHWIDVAVASLALVTLAPLLVVIAVIIRLDSAGPAIFRQTRIGRGGQPFVTYKFRSMAVDPAGDLRLFRDRDGRFRHKIAEDPRVTRAGRFLRRSSLDELPQLINVVRGEMSLVGPRPELPQIVQDYEPWQHGRHAVRPGITGWWQTQGRSACAMHEHTELDLYYVQHLSLQLDARIVVRTVRTVLSGLGAF